MKNVARGHSRLERGHTSACATTTFNSTWKAPDAQAGELSGQKVVAFVLTKNAASRRAAEDALAREITAGGAQGVPSYTLIADPAATDESQGQVSGRSRGSDRRRGRCARRHVEGSRRHLHLHGPAVTVPYWGGYYGYGWGGAWGGGVDVQTNTIVTVETLVYSLSRTS